MKWKCQRCKETFEQITDFQGVCECGGAGKPQERYGTTTFKGEGFAKNN